MDERLTEYLLKVNEEIYDIVQKYLQTSGLTKKEIEVTVFTITSYVLDDISWLTIGDPATTGVVFTGDTYLSAKALIYYRTSNIIHNEEKLDKEFRKRIARRISEQGKLITGIEIHPAAQIGRKLSIDHGYSTIIGETTEIGKECVILNGVILGATDVGENAIPEKRHPTIKDNVVICGFARVFGPVTIGNNVHIGPFATVLNDIPDDSKVRLIDQQQIITGTDNINIYGIIPDFERDLLTIFGKGFNEPEIYIIEYYANLDKQLVEIQKLNIIKLDENKMEARFLFHNVDEFADIINIKSLGLKIVDKGKIELYVPYSYSVTEFVKHMMKKGAHHEE